MVVQLEVCYDHIKFFFTVTRWTLSLMEDYDEPRWVKDGVLDCEEVWGLSGYQGIPQVSLQYPIVSSVNPDIVCFNVSEDRYVSSKRKSPYLV